jgi:hypothetical protein
MNEKDNKPKPEDQFEFDSAGYATVTKYAYGPDLAPDDEEANRYAIFVYDKQDEPTDVYRYRRARPGKPGDILLEHEKLQ